MNWNWSYSPETPNLGQIRRFLEPCDLVIWRMTLKNNRAPLQSIIKLYASFHHHMRIQTGVTVRKRLSWVVTSVTLTFDLWPWPFAWTSLLSLVITPENFMMIRWWEKRCDGWTERRTDAQTDGLNHSYSCLVAAENITNPDKIIVVYIHLIYIYIYTFCMLNPEDEFQTDNPMIQNDQHIFLIYRQTIHISRTWIGNSYR